MLASHYAPQARVRLDVTRVAAGEALLAFGPSMPADAEKAAAIINLSPAGDLRGRRRGSFRRFAISTVARRRLPSCRFPRKVSARRSTTGSGALPRPADG
jgi:hypothetical protein